MSQPISQDPADELIEIAVAVWLACVRREADAAGYGRPIESSERMRRNIRMLLIGIEAAGYAVVPLEPTAAMQNAGADVHTGEKRCGTDYGFEAEPEDMGSIYRAMLAARPR
jgi:hypothetical protein